MDFDAISNYIQPELLILIPTMWGIGMAVKQSKVDNKFIPIILMASACLISAIYLSSTRFIFSFQGLMSCIFASITQGCVIWLAAWASYEKFLKVSGQNISDEEHQ